MRKKEREKIRNFTKNFKNIPKEKENVMIYQLLQFYEYFIQDMTENWSRNPTKMGKKFPNGGQK